MDGLLHGRLSSAALCIGTKSFVEISTLIAAFDSAKEILPRDSSSLRFWQRSREFERNLEGRVEKKKNCKREKRCVNVSIVEVDV